MRIKKSIGKIITALIILILATAFNSMAEISFRLFRFDWVYESQNKQSMYDYEMRECATSFAMTALFNKRLLEVKGRDWYVDNIIRNRRLNNERKLMISLCFTDCNVLLMSFRGCSDNNPLVSDLLSTIDRMCELNDTIYVGTVVLPGDKQITDTIEAEQWISNTLSQKYADFFTYYLCWYGSGLKQGGSSFYAEAIGNHGITINGKIPNTIHLNNYVEYCNSNGIKPLNNHIGIVSTIDDVTEEDIAVYMDWLEKFWDEVIAASKGMPYSTFNIPFTYTNEQDDSILYYDIMN